MKTSNTIFAHKERFFTSSDEFSPNIAPNRIIRRTLEFLGKQNLSSKTTRKLAQARFVFADIPPSANIDKDLIQCQNIRSFRHYRLLLQWCEIFLKRKSFSAYNGDSKAFALLFDMNVLFESFVASEMKKWCSDENFRAKNSKYKEFMENMDLIVKDLKIKTQEKSRYFATENNQDRFQLKPDIVGYPSDKSDKDSKPHFIADTKWKILSTQDRNYGISQSDMYQMFAYLAKYQCNQGFLIYPKIGFVENREFIFKPESAKGVKLKICFFDIEV